MSKKDKKDVTVKEVEKLMTTDARFKVFKEKLKKLGYVKKDMAEVRQVMEVISDFGMMSDAGNKKIARAVSQSKSEKDLKSRLLKISTMAKGKYAEAEEDEVWFRCIFNRKQKEFKTDPTAMLMQLRKFKDITKDGEVRTDDMKKTKVKRDDAVAVHDTLMKVRAPVRTKYLQLLQKDTKSFNKAFSIY